jgi:hypothetical protein
MQNGITQPWSQKIDENAVDLTPENLFGQHIIRITFIYSAVNPANHRQNQTNKKGLYTKTVHATPNITNAAVAMSVLCFIFGSPNFKFGPKDQLF